MHAAQMHAAVISKTSSCALLLIILNLIAFLAGRSGRAFAAVRISMRRLFEAFPPPQALAAFRCVHVER